MKLNRRAALALAGVAGLTTLTACGPMMMGGGGGSDIVDVAAGDPQFSTLVTAIQTAGLTETLKGDGPFTVFAPTNEAFAALPEGTVEGLLRPENRDELVEILTYHVAPGNYPSSSLAGTTGRVETVQGGTLHVDGTDGVTVNGANVIAADVTASNGVIHVIDEVLLP